MVHRPLTTVLQLVLFCAICSRSCHLSPSISISAIKSLLQAFLGLPLSRSPWGFHCRACLVMLCFGFLRTNYLYRTLIIDLKEEIMPWKHFLCPRDYWSGGILFYPCPSVRPFVTLKVCIVCPANFSYSFRATALIFCRMFIYIMEVCISTGIDFHQIFSKWQVVGLSHFVRLSGYRYMVCLAISSYSFGATALIFCRMFIHIMEVCMSTGFWWSGGGIICVLQTHFIFKKSLLTKQLCP